METLESHPDDRKKKPHRPRKASAASLENLSKGREASKKRNELRRAAKEAGIVIEDAPKQKRLMTRIREMMGFKGENGSTRLDGCADAFVRMMEAGSFIHMKEYIEREEGKVAQRFANGDGTNLKLYQGMPLDDDPDAP